MFLSWDGHRAILLLVLTQNLVFASVNDGEKKTDLLSELIVEHLQVPWIDGIDWLLHSSESSEVNELKAWIQATESGERWAVQVLANISERQREIRRKTVQDIGVSGQCVKVSSDHEDTSSWSYRNMDLLDNESVISGELTSSACDAPSNNEHQAVECEAHTRIGSKDFATGEIAALFLFGTIGAFMCFCTICDFVKRRRPESTSTTVNTLAEFSLYTNAMALLSTKVTSETMPALCGLRCLSCCSIVIGHRYSNMLGLLRHRINILDILEYKTSWLAMCIYAAVFTVDTFLVIAGFLTTYLFLKSMKSGIKVNFLTTYLYRYFRLTPCLAATMLFIATLFHRAGDGPLWESSINLVVDKCQENWWFNLLYIQNLTIKSNMCLLQAWYLAVDMQLFWILQKQIESFNTYYISSVNRTCPYLIGVLLGYDIATKKRRLTQVNIAINWAVAGGLALFCVWANYQAATSDFAYDLRMETTLAFLLHPAWSIAVAWVIFACTQGYGGIATRFLSLPFFIPLSRISYCIFLVHALIQQVNITASKTSNISWGSEIFLLVFGELVLSSIIAFALSLFIESPVIVLIKILSNRATQPKRATLIQKQHKIMEPTTKN